MPAVLSRITVYPIKSLPGVDVSECRLLPSGALEWDRRFALFDSDGQVFNAKRSAKLHSLRVSYDLSTGVVQLQRSEAANDVTEFDLKTQLAEFAAAISAQLDESLGIGSIDETRKADDPPIRSGHR